MNKCTKSEIQDLLPDLEHGKLSAVMRQSVEEHVAACESCREDLRIIRTVKTAAVFAPAINVESVVRQIPPYRVPSLPREVPTRGRVALWLVASMVAVLLIGGGTLLKSGHQDTTGPEVLGIDSAPAGVAPISSPSPDVGVATPETRRLPALSLAADVRELSEDNLQQLMNDMDDFDALPNSEPEPVFAVDTGEGR